MYRDHDTLEPKCYYAKFPYRMKKAAVLVLDPMLATGGSASATLDKLKSEGAKDLKLVCIVGAPEGLERINRDHPDVEVFLAALDDGLNDQGYILPGLGDAGDRLFGTNDFSGQS
jgi:uracil phosphoribosyltransferase